MTGSSAAAEASGPSPSCRRRRRPIDPARRRLGARPAGPQPAPAADPRARRGARRGLHRDPRRPAVRRRRGDRHRLRPDRRPARRRRSASRRAPTPTRTSAATSGCRTPRATARRCGRWSSPSGSGCRSSRSSTSRAPIPARNRRSAGSPRRSPARSALMSRLRTPIVTVITGEGGSGGALAIAVADVVIALENAVYSVISPEGCASILWRTADEAPTAAAAMRMTAAEQQALGVVDTVVPEPGEGAHTDHAETARRLKPIIVAELDRLSRLSPGELLEARYHRFRDLGPVHRAGDASRRRRSSARASPTASETCSIRAAGRPARAATTRRRATRSDRMHDDRARQQPRRDRTVNERAADHAAIDRLADELLPALVAKLSATGLGEIEVREGPWRVRIRRPGDRRGGRGLGRRSTDRPSRAQPGHAGHGHSPAAFEGHRSARDAKESRPVRLALDERLLAAADRGRARAGRRGLGRRTRRRPSRATGARAARSRRRPPSASTSPRRTRRPGTRVRAGDRLGAVDMLGVAQEVVAPGRRADRRQPRRGRPGRRVRPGARRDRARRRSGRRDRRPPAAGEA